MGELEGTNTSNKKIPNNAHRKNKRNIISPLQHQCWCRQNCGLMAKLE